MILKLISIINFKNHENITLQFSNNINCFLGDNGVGKTNLLDAIHYLSFCKSYYTNLESYNVRYGQSYFMLKGVFVNNNNIELQVQSSLKDKKKHIKLNNKAYTKLSNHIGKIPLIMITPLDSNIILGGGEDRRRFIDKLLSQLDLDYLHQLIAYNKTLQQRNTLLKSYHDTQSELLLTYNEALSKYGSIIYSKRKDCISMIIDNVRQYYNFIAGDNEYIDVQYKSQLDDMSLADILLNNSQKDRILKHTTGGIHRDDFLFTIKSNNLKRTGSQGQQKTFLIALKFAYFDLLKSSVEEDPILLLDDIFDKLDDSRVEKIIKILNQNKFGQIFITDTNYDRINIILEKIHGNCKYFIFDINGLCDEKIKN